MLKHACLIVIPFLTCSFVALAQAPGGRGGIPNVTSEQTAAIAQMKALPVADSLYGSGFVRADGKFIHANRVWETKTPAESKGEWDQFKLLATIPQDKAFQPMEVLGCSFAKT